MKNKNWGYVILGILLLLFSVIAFMIPTEKTGAFWIAYIFTVIAIVAQIAIWKNTLGKESKLKSKFLGLPVVHIGVVYLLTQIVVFAIFAAVPALPTWSAIVACTVISGFSVIFMISGEVSRGEIERVEANVQKKVFFIKELQADVELLIEQEKDAEIKNALQLLAEKIRFSDPMSDDTLSKIEGTILAKASELKSSSDKMPIIQELNLLFTERNNKCRILK